MKIEISKNDYIAAIIHNCARRVLLNAIFMACLLVVGFVWSERASDRTLVFLIIIAICVTFAFFLYRFAFGRLLSYRAGKLYEQQTGLHQPFELNLKPEGLSFVSTTYSGIIPWANIYRWREYKDMFLVYQSDVLFHIIPCRVFASVEELDEFRKELVAHVGPVNTPRRPA